MKRTTTRTIRRTIRGVPVKIVVKQTVTTRTIRVR